MKNEITFDSATASKKHKKERKFVFRVVTSCSERMNKNIFFFREIICVNHKKMHFGQVQCENYELLTKFREINFPTKLSKCKLVSRFFPNMSNKFVKLQTSHHQTKNSSLCKWFHEKSLSIKVSSFTNELKVVI